MALVPFGAGPWPSASSRLLAPRVIDNPTANQAGAVLAGATAAQDLMLEAGNGIIVDEAVLATAGNLLLDAQGGDLAINNTVTATAGNASLLASANVTQAAAGDVSAWPDECRRSPGSEYCRSPC